MNIKETVLKDLSKLLFASWEIEQVLDDIIAHHDDAYSENLFESLSNKLDEFQSEIREAQHQLFEAITEERNNSETMETRKDA